MVFPNSSIGAIRKPRNDRVTRVGLFRAMRLRRRRKKPTYDGRTVGTEAVALKNIKSNASTFSYPENGFSNPVEHSLLYAMLEEPDIYPASAVLEVIEDEDFSQYLYVKPSFASSLSSQMTAEDDPVSYAQLTALLSRPNQWDLKSRVPEVLYKEVVKCVVLYAEENGLDRKTEADELLQPLLEYTEKTKEKATIFTLVGFSYYAVQTGLAIFATPLSNVLLSVTYNAATMGVVVKDILGAKLRCVRSLKHRAADSEQVSLLSESYDVFLNMAK